ncbi:uncharacterized protein LOC125859063 [Solanum stenotomum]|uniref:uncharacterized protein LOC125859063 n=1 Tax=Solanum stenotomum TaxID=172797 RepID=UPI0020CFFC74|nr:uncharacterized protein LOC125859063 [Solanum stenotomum]
MSIFSDMVEETIEVFMDDFSVVGDSFDGCLMHLAEGIKVDRAKVEVIEKLRPPICVKGVRSFFGYSGFYRRFIKDLSKIAHPLCKLHGKECKFEFDDACLRAFELLKDKLVAAPIIISKDPGQPFEALEMLDSIHVARTTGDQEEEDWDTPNGSLASSESASNSGSEFSSNSILVSGFISNSVNASSSEADSVSDIPVPPNTDPAPVAEEPSRWCVSGHYQIYRDARMLTE